MAVKLTRRGISLPQFERLVRAGITTVTHLQAPLAMVGYDAVNVQNLLETLAPHQAAAATKSSKELRTAAATTTATVSAEPAGG